MPRRLIAAGGLMLLAACATPQGPGNSLDARMMGRFDYICGDGIPVSVRFNGNVPSAEVRFQNEVRVLDRQPTRSGWIYSGADTQIMGTETQMQIIAPGLGKLGCRKV